MDSKMYISTKYGQGGQKDKNLRKSYMDGILSLLWRSYAKTVRGNGIHPCMLLIVIYSSDVSWKCSEADVILAWIFRLSL